MVSIWYELSLFLISLGPWSLHPTQFCQSTHLTWAWTKTFSYRCAWLHWLGSVANRPPLRQATVDNALCKVFFHCQWVSWSLHVVQSSRVCIWRHTHTLGNLVHFACPIIAEPYHELKLFSSEGKRCPTPRPWKILQESSFLIWPHHLWSRPSTDTDF